MSTSTQKTAILLYFYGGLMLLCGILYILLVGWSINLAIATNFIAGLGAIAIGYFMWQKVVWSFWAGLGLAALLFFLYGWLSLTHAYTLIDSLQNGDLNLKPYKALYQQANGLLITLSLFFTTIIVGLLQAMQTQTNSREL